MSSLLVSPGTHENVVIQKHMQSLNLQSFVALVDLY